MTQSQAFWKAVDLWGEGAESGYGAVSKDQRASFWVGKKVRAEFVILGKSEVSFEDAFENAKEVKK